MRALCCGLGEKRADPAEGALEPVIRKDSLKVSKPCLSYLISLNILSAWIQTDLIPTLCDFSQAWQLEQRLKEEKTNKKSKKKKSQSQSQSHSQLPTDSKESPEIVSSGNDTENTDSSHAKMSGESATAAVEEGDNFTVRRSSVEDSLGGGGPGLLTGVPLCDARRVSQATGWTDGSSTCRVTSSTSSPRMEDTSRWRTSPTWRVGRHSSPYMKVVLLSPTGPRSGRSSTHRLQHGESVCEEGWPLLLHTHQPHC